MIGQHEVEGPFSDAPGEPPFGERVVRAAPAALALGAFAALLAYPAALVLASRNAVLLPAGLAPRAIATHQSVLEAVAVALSAFIGLAWRYRARLPGLRRAPTAPRPLVALPGWIASGVAGAWVSACLFDRAHALAAPGLYASNAREAVALYAGSVLAQEALGRMLFLTLLVGLLRRPRLALVLHALWNTFFTFTLEQRFLRGSAMPDALGWRGLALGLVANLLFGAAYASHGLLGSVATHAAWNLKLLFLRAGS
jgi:hypothetical protein